MNIGFDIDGVLTDFEKFVIEYGQKYLNKKPENYNGLEIAEVFGVDKSLENSFWRDLIFEYSTSYNARPGTSETFQKLRNDGHKIFIITNRCTDLSYCNIDKETMKQYVQKWLDDENICYDEIVFNEFKSKLRSCQERHINIMIEDQLDHIEELSPHLKAICFKSSYNKNSNIPNLTYCESMSELYEIIRNLK